MALTMIFDAECVLCSRTVRFVLAHERDDSIRFVSTRSSIGKALAERHGLTDRDLDATFVVVDGAQALVRSDAAMRILKQMRAPWRWLRVLRFLPGRLRDAAYSTVARRRYQLFGRLDSCFVPHAAVRHRFLDGPSTVA